MDLWIILVWVSVVIHGVEAEGCALLVYLHRVLVPEGRIPSDELVHQDAEGPPVNGSRVALGLDDFGSEVLGSSAECVCFPYFHKLAAVGDNTTTI